MAEYFNSYRPSVWSFQGGQPRKIILPKPQQQVIDQAPLAESSGDDNNLGPGTTISGTPTQVNEPGYSSPAEAWQAGKAALSNSYWGTPQDAREQAAAGNEKAEGYLNSYVQNVMNNPVNLGPNAPGLIGLGLHHLGLNQNPHGGATQNLTDAVYGLEESGNLYDDSNSSGYKGEDLQTQQNKSDAHATVTYGDWSGWDDNHGDNWSDPGTNQGGAANAHYADDAGASNDGGGK